MKINQRNQYQLLFLWGFLLAIFLFLSTATAFSSGKKDVDLQKIKASYSRALIQQTTINKNILLKKSVDHQKSLLEEKINTAKLDQILQKKVQVSIPAGEKIRAFVNEINKQKALGLTQKEIFSAIESRLRAKSVQGNGVIQGTVTIDGLPPQSSVDVMAFDEYGFLAGSAELDWNGSYTISGLEPGSYYVLTNSNFVDEFYNDIPSNNYVSWRNATLVSVAANQTVTGINFDLQHGAVITGTVFTQNGTAQFAWNMVHLKIYSAASQEDPIEVDAFTSDQGVYMANVPATGSFKIYANSWGYEGEFYNHKSSWDEADVVTISSLNDTLQGIDFNLNQTEGPGPIPAFQAGAIEGQVTGTGGIPLNFTIMVAFNLQDTTVAGFALTSQSLTGGEVSPGEYIIAPLDSGNYIVYANDLIGPYGKEYYDGSLTPEGATPVHVTDQDTTRNINFTMQLGGAISGSVTTANGSPVDSILVIAIRQNIMDEDKFFSNIDFGFAFTNSTGAYTIRGLSTGDYVLRTISLVNKNYAGVVLDEWYENAHSIWDWNDATPVSVTAPRRVDNINFVLEPPSFISGRVLDASGTTPVGNVTLLALRAADNLPELAYAQSRSEDGSYNLGPLPLGDYKVFAFINPDNDAGYLPEFYDSARTLDTASTVSITTPGVVQNINFTLDQGGTIQGFVYLSSGFSAGADTVSDFPVVAYDAASGIAMGAEIVTFAGGYRISHLPPGNYKVCALPVMAPFAATYFGDGATFDDPNTTPVAVTGGDTISADITLGHGTDSITGNVFAIDQGAQVALPMAMVLAYDATGHAVSAGMSGFDLAQHSELPSASEYSIAGLRSGNYFVRTFSGFGTLMNLLDLSEGLNNGGPGLSTVPGLGDGNGLLPGLPFLGDLKIDLTFYQDQWYDGVPIRISPSGSLMNLFWELLTSSGDVTGFIPFYSVHEAGAQVVASNASGIDFILEELDAKNIFSDVTENGLSTPSEFVLNQNYPNPVRLNRMSISGTSIRYSIPQNTHVEIAIYNILGQKVATLINQNQMAGFHRVVWNGMDRTGRLVSNGIYFYELKAGNRVVSLKKMVILR